ncbi:MAG TPA: DUF6351 family protein [Povalibacter sp.]|nr:DUF6351 family protein [Povalibacter sp.]
MRIGNKEIGVLIAAAITAFVLLTVFAPLLNASETDRGRRDESPPRDVRLRPGSMSFWIGDMGPTGPVYTGPQQYPFICLTSESGLGQPLVDNQSGIGNAVYAVEGNNQSGIVGYSSKCSIRTRVDYFYYNGTTFRRFNPATDFATPPADLRFIPVNGAPQPFVVRVEAGTLNRFLYTIAMLAPFPEQTATPQALDTSTWNHKLIYWLRGGVGIGHQQGRALWHDLPGRNARLSSSERALFPPLLAQGFAIVTSSGNETGVHYNLRLAEETALMVKRHFGDTYGDPQYTVGLGGSGGAIQQYAFAQNNRNILDAGIPTHSYPDMVTQTIHVGDCNLLEQYFLEEIALDPASQWATWSNRRLVEGLNSSDTVINPLTRTPGSSECINGWFGAAQLVINPVYTDPGYLTALQFYSYPPAAIQAVKWTHWNDLANIYGTDSAGFAPIPMDNVGVQYGLRALLDGDISAQEFLRINACVGAWKEQRDFVNWNAAADPFDATNMRRTADCRTNPANPAPRRKGDIEAMRAAYTSGHVFTGQRLDIPVVDVRPYLEPVLDMHNSRQSFSVRARLQDQDRERDHGHSDHRFGHHSDADNQVIWFAGSDAAFGQQVFAALQVLDQYLTTRVRPAAFTDQCVAADGSLIAAGEDAWNGILDEKAPGPCTTAFPLHSSSRMVAGDSIRGDLFKCELKPLGRALHDGTYGRRAPFTAAEIAWLRNIFPSGVCDYSKPDVGQPRDH